MRTLPLIGLAALTLATGAADVQARARIRLGRVQAPAAIRPVEQRPAPGLAARRDPAGAGPTYVSLPSQASVAALPAETAEPVAAAPAPTAALPPQESAAALAPGVAGPAAAPTAAPATAKAPAQAVIEAGPWCPSGRVVGTGAGFCMVN